MARYEYLNVTNLQIGAPGSAATLDVGNGATGTTTVTMGGAGATSITIGGSAANTLNIGTTGTSNAVQIGAASKPGTLTVGVFSSATAGSGTALSSSRTAAFRVYADDGGVELTGTAVRAGISRMLIATAVSPAVDLSVFGFQGQVKVAASTASSAHIAGLYGLVEVVAAKTIDVMTSAIMANVELPSTAVIGTGVVLSAFRAHAQDLGGTHTGKAAVLDIPNPLSGTWDFFAHFGSATGCTSSQATALSGVTTAQKLAIRVDTSTLYIPLIASFS